jgi:hypothetical protein
MKPKFSDGAKVKIKVRDATGQVVYRELEKYENASGVVVSSKTVIAYFLQPMTFEIWTQRDLPTTVLTYTVKLEEGVTLEDLTEYCLEQI